MFTLVEALVESGKNVVNIGSCEELLAGDEDGERSVASAEDQLRKEMTVYEVYGWKIISAFCMFTSWIHSLYGCRNLSQGCSPILGAWHWTGFTIHSR